MKKAAFFLSIALLFVTAYSGITEAVEQLGQSGTALQKSVTFAVLIYGVLGLIGGLGLMRRRPWTVTVVGVWGLATLWAGTVASFAYHDPTFALSSTLVGTATAFVGLAVVCGLVLWEARVATRKPSPIASVRDASG